MPISSIILRQLHKDLSGWAEELVRAVRDLIEQGDFSRGLIHGNISVRNVFTSIKSDGRPYPVTILIS